MITPGKKSHSTCGQEAGAGDGPEISAWRKREKILKFGGREEPAGTRSWWPCRDTAPGQGIKGL